MARLRLVAALGLLAGCSAFSAPDRADGDRTPLAAACESLDGTRCILPWPSNTFTKADPTTPTGLRLALSLDSLGVTDDDPSYYNRADGFSRLTPLLAGFSPALDPATVSGPTAAIRLLAVTPLGDGSDEVAVRATATDDDAFATPLSLLVGHPVRPLRAASDYVVVVADSLRDRSGQPYKVPRAVQVALGLEPPASDAEAQLRGYHAPTRRVLARAAIDPSHVLRVFSFTTRSADDATSRLKAMIAAMQQAVAEKRVAVVLDSVSPAAPPLLAVVVGHLDGVPQFVGKDGALSLGSDGQPQAQGTTSAPFRITIPSGSDDYRVVYYGHGTGGNLSDDAFDSQFAQYGAAKVSFRFDGWTDLDFLPTLGGLQTIFKGAGHFSALTLQSIARGAAVQAALSGVLADALSAPLLGPTANPAAGRRPKLDIQTYAGGSLGGTLGLVIASSLPGIEHAVLNVPGAGWSHFVPGSLIWNVPDGLLSAVYGSLFDSRIALAITQGIWDEFDGAAWSDHPPKSCLVQESIGDPVLPNIGSELLAAVVGAGQLGKALTPIPGLPRLSGPTRGSAITQYRVPSTFGAYQIHGFITCHNAASVAAQAQVLAFVRSVWQGDAQISLPSECPSGSCDFSTSVTACN